MTSYPLLCAGGYPVPSASGKVSICGVRAIANSNANVCEVALIDESDAKAYGALATDQADIVVHMKWQGGYDAETQLSEPVKVRNGISFYTSNVTDLYVYVR